MSAAADREVPELERYRAEISGYTLTELEDVHAHLDRRAFPERATLLREEIEVRLRALGARPDDNAPTTVPAHPFRRLWAAFVDVFITTGLPVGIYLLYRMATAPATAPGPRPGASGRGRGRGEGPVPGFLDRLLSGEVTFAEVKPYVVAAILFAAYRALITVPQWIRRGETTGFREAGVRLESVDGERPGFGQAATRFLAFYLFFLPTLGLGTLWMVWDRERRALHDRLSGTRVVRIVRPWDKPEATRLLD